MFNKTLFLIYLLFCYCTIKLLFKTGLLTQIINVEFSKNYLLTFLYKNLEQNCTVLKFDLSIV